MAKLGTEALPEWQELEKVDHLSSNELDDLPFGVIQLDEEGVIQMYNATESEISGRSPKEVLGKNFFEEVAPCTNVKEFAGRFFEGVEKRNLNCTFPYLFDFRMRPTRVWIRMYFSERTETAWIFVTRQENAAA
jgi:photoactive yellow protein